MIINEEDYLAHYGTPRKSGRYPWGSGNEPVQANGTLLSHISDMRKQGLSDPVIAKGLGISTTQFRAMNSIAKSAAKQEEITTANRLKAKQMSNVAIGLQMGRNESYIRTLLAENASDKSDRLQATANMLKEELATKKYLDVGSGVEHHINVSDTTLKTAVALLAEEGYATHNLKVQQLGTGKETNLKVLVGPDVTYSELYQNRGEIKIPGRSADDRGLTFEPDPPPMSIDPKRVAVKYADEGGAEADGVIFVRPGVKDVQIGNSAYAQVRVKVGEDRYLKGMAMYKDDLPDGVDLMFNTNKKDTGNHLDAMKKMEGDPDLPFGAVTRPPKDENGKKRTDSVMNIVNEEGDWTKWSKTLSSQILSKQSATLAKAQLDEAYSKRKEEFDEINSLTNPTIRKALLVKFGDSADLAAVHLKAAALPRQGWHAILPVASINPMEIYAPKYRNGERVALIRYPHGGTFEIPELTVNNNHPESKKLLGNNPRDAVGIHHTVAERLSGADFDGDTVLVIPNDSRKIKSTPSLEGLKNFNPREQYKEYPGMVRVKPETMQHQMGSVSNLITDMTIRKAPPSEIVKAVRHSMVVIDSYKHNLNYKQSALDNGIAGLKAKYQASDEGGRSGAATIISRAESEIRVAERKPRSAANGGPIDKVTGQRMYEPTGKSYVNKEGVIITPTTKSKRLAETTDAFSLVSATLGTPVERVYAGYSNKVKALANDARRIAVNTPDMKRDPTAARVYKPEVDRLTSALRTAQYNSPLERQAQVVGNATISMKKAAKPDMEPETLKKLKHKELETARARIGAKKDVIIISDREWEAIQAGAVSPSKLKDIISNSDLKTVRALAMPRSSPVLSTAEAARAQSMLDRGATRAEVADAIGVSISTLDTKTDVKGFD